MTYLRFWHYRKGDSQLPPPTCNVVNSLLAKPHFIQVLDNSQNIRMPYMWKTILKKEQHGTLHKWKYSVQDTNILLHSLQKWLRKLSNALET